MQKELTESLEKYLLAIYEIVKINNTAKVRDVANYLNVGSPTASEAVKNLALKGFINYVPYSMITINEKGQLLAEKKIRRHQIICNFFENVLMVEKNKIDEYARQL